MPPEEVERNWEPAPFAVSIGGKLVFESPGIGASATSTTSTTSGLATVTAVKNPSAFVSKLLPKVEIRHDDKTLSLVTIITWVTDSGDSTARVQFTIPDEQLLRGDASPLDIWMRMLDSQAEKMPEHVVRDAKWAASHYFAGAHDGHWFENRAHEPSATAESRFPETASAVLATLEAEVEMCEDGLQRLRLEGILRRLQRLAPVEPDPSAEAEVASAS